MMPLPVWLLCGLIWLFYLVVRDVPEVAWNAMLFGVGATLLAALAGWYEIRRRKRQAVLCPLRGRIGGFSRWLKVFPPSQFAKNTAHRFLSQAGISVHNLGNGHACGERLKNKSDGNACSAHTRAASKVLRVTDNPVVHRIKLTPAE